MQWHAEQWDLSSGGWHEALSPTHSTLLRADPLFLIPQHLQDLSRLLRTSPWSAFRKLEVAKAEELRNTHFLWDKHFRLIARQPLSTYYPAEERNHSFIIAPPCALTGPLLLHSPCVCISHTLLCFHYILLVSFLWSTLIPEGKESTIKPSVCRWLQGDYLNLKLTWAC